MLVNSRGSTTNRRETTSLDLEKTKSTGYEKIKKDQEGKNCLKNVPTRGRISQKNAPHKGRGVDEGQKEGVGPTKK